MGGIAGLIALFLLIFFGGLYGIIQLGKKICVYEAQIFITDKKITIRRCNEWPVSIGYNDISSYRYQVFNGGYELRIRLLNGDVQKLNTGGELVSAADTAAFAAMAAAFESVVSEYQQLQGKYIPVLREKTFFEKPIATVLLVVYAVVVVTAICLMVIRHKFMPNALGSFGLFIAFVAAWRAARRQRHSS
ncbi:hypothetical protein GCM10027345_04820 [Hymenobacter daeguensis]